MTSRRRVARLAALVGCMLALGACAPPRPGSLESLEVTARREAERREHHYADAEGVAVMRLDGRATGKLPALDVRLDLDSPDRVRLQFRWLLGVLGDVVARGDTLVAWVPSERLGVMFGGLDDSLGVHEPARFLAQALTAAWVAPHEAWRDAAVDSAGVGLAWTERDGDAWTMHVDRHARPTTATVTRGDHTITIRVSAWDGTGAHARPERLEIADGDGWVRLRLDVDDLHPVRHRRASAFALVLPADARTLDWGDLTRLLSLGGLAR